MSRFQVLSDAQWSLIEGMLPRPTGRPGRKFSDARTMVEAIIYRYRCGIAWRDLPEVFGPWQTVWTWHHRLATEGTWDKVLAKLTAAADAAGIVDWSLSVDYPPHRGLDRITRIRRKSRLITGLAAPGAACPRRFTSSSTATGSPWSPSSRPAKQATHPCSCR